MCCPAPVLNRIPAERQTAPSARNPRQPDPPPSHHAPPLSPRPARRVPALAPAGSPPTEARGERGRRSRPALTVGAALLELLPRPLPSLYFRHGSAAPLRAHVRPPPDGNGTAVPVGQRGKSAVRARHRGTTAAARGRERRAPPRSAARRGCPGGRPPGRGRRSERHLLFSQRNNSEARRSAPGSLFGGRA